MTALGLTVALLVLSGCEAPRATIPVATTAAPAAATTLASTTSASTAAVTTPETSPGVTDAAPAAMLNPAVTQATVASTICVAGYTKTIRPPSSVTNQIKVRQIKAYGYGDVTPGSFEEDHVIPLELGGAAAADANLFPEPLAIAGQDDGLENALHRQVCAGTVTLAAAQAQVLAAKAVHGYLAALSVAGTPAP